VGGRRRRLHGARLLDHVFAVRNVIHNNRPVSYINKHRPAKNVILYLTFYKYRGRYNIDTFRTLHHHDRR